MHTKEILAEFIFNQNQNSRFFCGKKFWSDPESYFSHCGDITSELCKKIREGGYYTGDKNNIICLLADWKGVPYEGILFSDTTMYVNSPKNKDKRFSVRYDEITQLNYFPQEPSLTISTKEHLFRIDTDLWSKLNIHDFLQFASEAYRFHSKRKEEVNQIKLETLNGKTVGAFIAGQIYSNVSNASSIYFDDKIVSPRGHGFAAEHANHLGDLYQGKNAYIVGDNNAKNGADRVVDGVNIQSKYCASGARCVQECFENGQFRYWNADGTPMQVEVPSDMYEAAIQAMESRIQRGEVAGITDPAEAKNIIRKGHFTYTQVKNIAKAGTIESITYDAASGLIVARNAFGITAVLTFAMNLWNGEDFDVAVKSAVVQGLKVGGIGFVTSILAGQLSKAGLNSMLVNGSEQLVRLIGPKASAYLVNAFRAGNNIYGATAMKSMAKLLRTNAITGAVSVVVLSIGDVTNIFRGRISGGQLIKNVTNTTASVAGGTAGWTAGAAAGAALGSIVPGIGTAIGGVIGGIAGAVGGGAVSSKISGAVMDSFIEDDADKMVRIIQEVFTVLAEEYLITQREAEVITDRLKDVLTGSVIKDMFASKDRELYARELLLPYFEAIALGRPIVRLPSLEVMQGGLKNVLEELADLEKKENRPPHVIYL